MYFFWGHGISGAFFPLLIPSNADLFLLQLEFPSSSLN